MTTNIPMMKLRTQPGSVLDRVFYRGERFIIEKAGEPRAAIVPVREYEEMLRRKAAAKEQFFALSDKIKQRTRQYNPQEVQAAIEEAVEVVRGKNKPN